MNCARARKLISLVIDGAAGEHQKRLLDFHLMGCPSCRRAFRMSSDIARLSHELPDPTPPSDLESAVRHMLAAESARTAPAKRLRTPLLAIPAVAALMVLVMTLSPLPGGDSGRGQELRTVASASVTSKVVAERTGSKSRVRTTPLSAYSRQASLISF